MKPSLIPVTGTLFLVFTALPPVHAASLVEMKTPHTGLNSVWIEGKKMRVDSPQQGYMIMDFDKQKIYAVNPREKSIVDLSSSLQKDRAAGSTALKIELQAKGAGPRIAGYPTQQYSVRVNGQNCATSYTSMPAMRDSGFGPLIEGMSYLNFNPMMEQYMDPCEKASAQIAQRFQKLGMPLRQMGKQGELVYEVIRIEKNARLPKGGFALPENYQVIDMQRQMGGMMPGMTPEMRKSMEQMMQQYNH